MKYYQRLICMVLAFFLCGNAMAGIKKSNLKILYLGGSPDVDTFNQKDSLIIAESIKRRTASFEKMLKQYFKEVTVMDAKNYVPAMSDDYDVTVVDGTPPAIQPEVKETDADGRIINYTQAAYLPWNFSRPMLFIAEMSSVLGHRIGLKLDWCCLCLDAEAHSMRLEHPIFKGPFPVEMNLVKKPTPEGSLEMARLQGEQVPDSLMMWRVQKEGYKSNPMMRIGMVSRPEGFEDSPDAEFISGGVSLKALDAVAIGRHGNFFHWGFAASPDDMTQEAKNVLANAIVYIAQFAGQTPIARKYDEKIPTREETKMIGYMASRERYESTTASGQELTKQMQELRKIAEEKQAKGENLTDIEQYALTFQAIEVKSYETYLQEQFSDLFYLFGTEGNSYADYFEHNADYLLPNPRNYGFLIDEDARSLGISNNDINLLDRAIALWESGEDKAKGRRLLERYTLCRFDTPAEWRAWYEANKSRLFFTEAGGWLFLVNTRDTSVPGNDYQVRLAKKDKSVESKKPTSKDPLTTDDKNPVRLLAKSETLPNGNRMVSLRLRIHPGYHIYARVADSDPFVATTVEFRLPEGVEAVGEMQRPSGKVYNSAGTVVYEGEIEFRQEVSGQGTVTCAINYQCCNDQICMPPAELVLTAD